MADDTPDDPKADKRYAGKKFLPSMREKTPDDDLLDKMAKRYGPSINDAVKDMASGKKKPAGKAMY